MKKLFTYLMVMATLLIGGGKAMAQSVTIDGVVYSVSGDHAYVSGNDGTITDVTLLSAVTIGDTNYPVVKIGDGAFEGNTSLTSVNIPSSITELGESVFKGCSSLTSVSMSSAVKSIGLQAFFECSVLIEVDLPEGLEFLGEQAFVNCKKIVSINIPRGVERISNNTFRSCTSLTTVVLSEGLISIGPNAFKGCTKLKNVEIPTTVNSITSSAFDDTQVLFPEENGIRYAGNIAFQLAKTLAEYVIKDGTVKIQDNLFSNCTNMTSITIPSSVVSIGENAFSGCTSLPIENGIRYADCYAIEVTDKTLTEYTLKDNVRFLGNALFQDCSAMTSVTIPAGVTEIGKNTFAGCSALDSITLPENLTSLGSYAFYYCSSLPSVDIPDGVTVINDYTFYGCSALTSIALPDSLTSIGSYAFNSCSSLPSVDIPSRVTVINDYTFQYCSALVSMTLPEGLTSIGNGAFRNCSALTTVTLSPSLTSIASDAFYQCNNLQKIINYSNLPLTRGSSNYGYVAHYAQQIINVDTIIDGFWFDTDANGKHHLTYYEGTDSILTLPSDFQDGNYGIDANVFSGHNEIVSIQFPDGITSIGASAFSGCSALTSITLPESLTSIGSHAFYTCSSLTSVDIPSRVTEIGNHTFAGCSALTSITLPESLTSIGSHAFYMCSSLTSVDIPSRVTVINDYTFQWCHALVSMTLREGVTSIGNGAFNNCSALTTVTLSPSLTSIASDAFYQCIYLQKIINYSNLPLTRGSSNYGYVAYYAQQVINVDTIIDGFWFDTDANGKHHLTYYEGTDSILTLPSDFQDGNYGIDANVFSGHNEIVSIQFPDGITSIGASAFYGCSSLTSLTLPESVTSIGGSAFYNCSSLTSVNIPSGIPSIGANTFYGCSSLTSLTLPESVTSIGGSAFYNCSSLTSVNIPSGVPSIGDNTFYGCSSLISLTIPANVASIGNYAFNGCTGLKELTIADANTTLSLGHKYNSDSGLFGYCKLEKLYYGRNLSYNTSSSYGYSPFRNITTLKEVIVGDSVTAIQANAFYNCSSLVSINIPEKVNSIGEYTFYNCSALTSLTIPASVTSLGNNSFYGCTSLKELTFVDGGVTLSLGSNSSATANHNYGLFNCSSLEKLYLGRNLSFSTNGNYVPFKDQIALTEVVVGDSVTSIYARSFYGCSALNSLSLPETVSSIGTEAFYGCTALTYLYCGSESPEALRGSNLRTQAVIYVPEGTYVPYKELFPNNIIVDGTANEITVDITIPGTLAEEVLNRVPYIRNVNSLKVSGTLNDNDIATINESMVNLLHLDMSKLNRTSVSGIGHANLCSIVFPDSCKSISGYRDRDNLTSIILPDAVTTLGSECFDNCDQLAEVTMSANLKTVGSNAFYNCDKLKEITFKDGLTSIGDYAFSDCGSLTSVSLGDGMTYIGADAFRYCSNLRTLVIGDGISVFNTGSHGAFRDCSKLSEIHIPDIEAWLNSSFHSNHIYIYNFPNYASSNVHLYIDGELLTDVVIPSTVTSIRDYAFYQIKGINSVTISDGVTSIGEHAFNGCYDLSSVTIAEGVHTIQGNAFANCDSLRSVTLPSTLRSCAAGAFTGSGLAEVICPSFFPPVTGGDMIGANNCTLYVPEWTLNRYKLANNWNLFAFIEPLEGIYPSTISVYTEEALAIPDEGLVEGYTPNLEIVRYDASNVGRLTLRGEKAMPLSTFRMEQTRDAGTMTSLVNYGTLTADSVATELTISANTWHYLTFPYDVKIADIATLGDWVIRRYDGASRARADFSSTWQNVPYDSILHAGEGYIWYSTNGNFTVPAIENDNRNLIFANEARYTQLKEHASATEANYGWNLIGNPYPCFYDTRFMEFSSPITVRSGNSYAAYSPVDDSYILSPLEAFFVQCSAENNIVAFETEGRQTDNTVRSLTSAPKRSRAASSDRKVFNLYLENESYADHSRFVINENAAMTYEIACDAAKFMSDDPAVQQLFTIEGGERMAINERPFANGEVTLGTYFGKSGSYTIALDTRVTDMVVVLIDMYTGAETDLMTDSYTFTTETGTYTDRFAIRMKRIGDVTAIEAVSNAKVEVTAMNGSISITNATTPIYIYNAAGVLVTTQNGNAVTIEVAPGIYIVKVGDEVHKVSVIK